MGEVEIPVRGKGHQHQCLCLVLRPHPSGRKLRDRCYQPVYSPDQPFCDDCTGRHPEAQKEDGVIVTQVEIVKGAKGQ